MDFAGLYKPVKTEKIFALIAVERMVGWPIPWATTDFTAETVMRFIEEDMVLLFGPPKRIFSDNAIAFAVGSVQEYMKEQGV